MPPSSLASQLVDFGGGPRDSLAVRCAFLLFCDDDGDDDDGYGGDGVGGEECSEGERLFRFDGFEGEERGEGESERDEAEVLEELTARWRSVPSSAFGLRDGVRPPANAAGVQCVAYYGEGPGA